MKGKGKGNGLTAHPKTANVNSSQPTRYFTSPSQLNNGTSK